jgi:flagellum-specific ATP synthase
VRAAGQRLRGLLAAHREKADLIAIGAYQPGGDSVLDEAIAKQGRIESFLRQGTDEPSSAEEADARLLELAGGPEEQSVAPGDSAAALGPTALATGPSAIPPLNLSV